MRRLLFVIGQLGYGGSEGQMVLLARHLARTHHVEVICTSTDVDPFGARLAEAGIRVRHPEVSSKPARLWWLVRTLRQVDCDVVIFFSIRNLIALFTTFLVAAPVVFTERSLGVWKSRAYRAVDRLLYRRCALILANSEATKDFICRHFPAHAGRVRVVYNGIEERPHPGNDVLTAPRMVFALVAGLRPWKGHAWLLEAVEVLVREGRDLTLLLVGDGALRPQLEEAVRDRDLEDVVRFLGWQPDPCEVLGRVHVNLNVSSSSRESLSNGVLEGMLLGRASIVTNVGGNPELVEDGVTGRVVEYGDVEQLAAAMRFFMDDREAAQRCGDEARRRVLRRYPVERMVEQTRALIHGLGTNGKESA